MAYQLDGGCAAQASECEERQNLRTEEVVDSRGNIKSLNDDVGVQFYQGSSGARSPGRNAEHHSGANSRSASSTFTAKKFHDSNESEDVEEESDEDEVQKPVINFKLKRSGQARERLKSRRELKSELKDELFKISTAIEVKG